MYTFILFLLVTLVFYLWFGKRKYVNFAADYRKRVRELETEVKKLKIIDWEELEKEKSKELIVIQDLIEKQEELLESLKSDTLSTLQWRRGRIREHTEKLYPERIIGPYDQKLVEEKYKKVKKELKNYSNPTIAFILGVEYPHEKGYGFELKVSPYFAILLLDHLDMVIDHKIGNPYKKGLAKCREIVEKSFEEVYCYVPAFFPYKIKDTYIEDKMTAIRLKYEIEEYNARQVEERRAILQAQREELASQREIEREIKRAYKDEKEAQAKLERRRLELAQAHSAAEIARLKDYIEHLQLAVKEAQQRHERALSMAQQTRAGYVYVISNIGSFGEGIYKIGMTRRIEPMERVVELGDASVPFPFDVHAMIWSEDAPTLEAELHRTFDDRKVNAINGRKEFFRVTLDEVRTVLDRMGVDAAIVDYPTAAQYRDSLMIAR